MRSSLLVDISSSVVLDSLISTNFLNFGRNLTSQQYREIDQDHIQVDVGLAQSGLCAAAQMGQPASRLTTEDLSSTISSKVEDRFSGQNAQRLMKSVDDNLDIPESLQRCQIYQWLRNGEFWSKDFVREILPQIKIEFLPELQHLKSAKADMKGVGGNGRDDTFAMHLYAGEDGTFEDSNGITQDKATTYYEIDRSLTAVRALLWIRNDQVEAFNPDLARAQLDAETRRSENNDAPWSWIRQQFMTEEANVFLKEQAHLCYALITSVIINDVGKDQNLSTKFKQVTGHDLQVANHDAYLRACIDAGMIPSINKLPKATRDSVMLGIDVSGECNLGQFAQGENLPASLYPLTRFRQDNIAWRLRFMEQILDLAGARGHINNKQAMVFGPAVARGNRKCQNAAEQIIRGVKPRVAYDWYLQSKYEYLVNDHGYTTVLDVQNRNHRALMRIFCLTGCSSKSLADICEDVLLYSDYTKHFRDDFIAALNEEGLEKPGIQVTYLPALLDGVLRSEWSTTDELKRGLACAFEYAKRCSDIDEGTRTLWQKDGITVMERDIFEISQWVRNDQGQKSAFVRCPSLLVESALPDLVLVNKVEPGYEGDFIGMHSSVA